KKELCVLGVNLASSAWMMFARRSKCAPRFFFLSFPSLPFLALKKELRSWRVPGVLCVDDIRAKVAKGARRFFFSAFPACFCSKKRALRSWRVRGVLCVEPPEKRVDKVIEIEYNCASEITPFKPIP
ncbi:MAG: hypothetical protein ONB07_11150, partial [candidate division KSB1 bacterium]|nr:hypothetical protein [candidate division KSB1 bacterium]